MLGLEALAGEPAKVQLSDRAAEETGREVAVAQPAASIAAANRRTAPIRLTWRHDSNLIFHIQFLVAAMDIAAH